MSAPMKLLRVALLMVAAAWLGLCGVIVPYLIEIEADTAAAHCIILSLLALALIAWLSKPAKTVKGRA